MANDQLYYQTHSAIARGMLETISEVDTFARLGRGRFLLILSRPATRSDVEQAQRNVLDRWLHSLKQSGSPVESITVDTAVVHCPQDGAEWEGLLLLLEQKLDAQ
jgi:GGDEF domain-containing protein